MTNVFAEKGRTEVQLSPNLATAIAMASGLTMEQQARIGSMVNSPSFRLAMESMAHIQESFGPTARACQALTQSLQAQSQIAQSISQLYRSEMAGLAHVATSIQVAAVRLNESSFMAALSVPNDVARHIAALSGQVSSSLSAFEHVAKFDFVGRVGRIPSVMKILAFPSLGLQSSVFSFDSFCLSQVADAQPVEIGGQGEMLLTKGGELEPLLRPALHQLKPDLVDIWEGARGALQSDNPDKWRQAAHSMRELLRVVLDLAAPDSSFTPQEIVTSGHNGNPTRKMRVKKILAARSNSTLVQYVDNVASTIDSLYGLFSDYAHTGKQDTVTLQTALVAGEAILCCMLRVDKKSQ